MAFARSLARSAQRQFRRLRLQWFNRIDAAALRAAVLSVVPSDNPGLFVHSALGACGYFDGGCEMVISELGKVSPNLSMPTHTYCYPKREGEMAPLYDARKTASVVGALTNQFWRMEGVVRSFHPTHSIGARGPLAEHLTAGHELCETPCGDGTPYPKMISAGFSVLMLGASLNAYTLFHTAEDEAQVPYLYYPQQYDLRVLDALNGEKSVRMWRQDMTVPRRFADMDRELEAAGLLCRAPLGRGELLCIMDSKHAHEFLVDLLRREPYHLVRR